MIFDINIFYFFTSFVVNIFLFEFGKVSNVFLIFRGNMVGGYLGAKRERGVKNTPPHRREIPPPLFFQRERIPQLSSPLLTHGEKTKAF